jgi:glyoxylase-like metal-dependent hydrolase (beta-lactamase superfamily II)
MREILPRVYSCEFSSPKTYEANAYLILSERGNILVEVPEFVPRMLTELEFFGGVRYIFLTHRDDVGDACKFKKHFDARIIMHESERDHVPCGVDISFEDDFQFDQEITLIHTPGHSPGASCLLLSIEAGILFCGDHLLGNDHGLVRPVRFEWTWNWKQQLASARKLLTYPFEIVIPAHASLKKGYIDNGKKALKKWLDERSLGPEDAK